MDDVKEDFLELAKKVELQLAALYDLFARTFVQDREFWKKMANEENTHARLIGKFEEQYKKKFPKKISDKSISMKLVNVLSDISEYTAGQWNRKIERKEAFEKALECESLTVEAFFHDFFQNLPAGDDDDILKMIQRQDKRHMEDLKNYIKSHKF